MKLWALDPYEKWGAALIACANERGWSARRVRRGADMERGGYGFIRLSMETAELARNRQDYAEMRKRLTMVQDQAQIDVYEDKSEQWRRWGAWMPDTWRFTKLDDALAFLAGADFPIVSKADTGASSRNVRVLGYRDEAEAHAVQVFKRGIPIERGRVQRGYLLLQRFIPHRITYRVNALGNARAAFFRYCYPDRPVAQTGNVDPAMEMTEELESLFEFSDGFFRAAGTKWCAIDVLKDGDKWKLLETSEGWPWPSPGTCNQAPIFRSTRSRRWIEMMDLLLDEIEEGAFSSS